MRRGHLNHLDVVRQRLQAAEGFVNALDELGGEARLHVLEFTFELFKTVAGLYSNSLQLVLRCTRLFVLRGDSCNTFLHLW